MTRVAHFGLLFSRFKFCIILTQTTIWATFWAILLQTLLVTLGGIDFIYVNDLGIKLQNYVHTFLALAVWSSGNVFACGDKSREIKSLRGTG
jgi:hypothetical protein